MPNYQFENSKGKIFEFFFPFESAPSIGSEIEVDGVKFRRAPSLTNNIVDSVSKVDVFDAKKFTEITKNKSGTFGSLLDLSAEMSEARAEKTGNGDPVKNKFTKEKDEKMDARRQRNRARKAEQAKISKLKKKS